jgi:hypothetical protein
MQTAIFTVGPRSVEMLAEVSRCLSVVKAKYDGQREGHPEEARAKRMATEGSLSRQGVKTLDG